MSFRRFAGVTFIAACTAVACSSTNGTFVPDPSDRISTPPGSGNTFETARNGAGRPKGGLGWDPLPVAFKPTAPTDEIDFSLNVCEPDAVDEATVRAAVPKHKQPSFHRNLCTAYELEEMAGLCLKTAESAFRTAACKKFQKEHPICMSCLVTNGNAPAETPRGPFILTGGGVGLNHMGCIDAFLEKNGCGAQYLELHTCVQSACEKSCKGKSVEAISECAQVAHSGVCSSFRQAWSNNCVVFSSTGVDMTALATQACLFPPPGEEGFMTQGQLYAGLSCGSATSDVADGGAPIVNGDGVAPVDSDASVP